MAKRHPHPPQPIPADLQVPLGRVLKAWREHRGLAVTDLAARAGVTKGYISSIEHNRIAQPKVEYLGKLAGALDISVLDLVSRRMPPKSSPRRARLPSPKRRPPQSGLSHQQVVQLRAKLRILQDTLVSGISRIEKLLGEAGSPSPRQK